jgi:hypothetical protein
MGLDGLSWRPPAIPLIPLGITQSSPVSPCVTCRDQAWPPLLVEGPLAAWNQPLVILLKGDPLVRSPRQGSRSNQNELKDVRFSQGSLRSPWAFHDRPCGPPGGNKAARAPGLLGGLRDQKQKGEVSHFTGSDPLPLQKS